jgi:hypothetical protein
MNFAVLMASRFKNFVYQSLMEPSFRSDYEGEYPILPPGAIMESEYRSCDD